MTIENHFIGNIAVKAIIAKDDKLLIVRAHKNPATWELPGGRININEDIPTALKREVLEELGVEINVGPLIYSEQLPAHEQYDAHLFIFLKAELVDRGAPLEIPSEELAEARWIDQKDLNKQEIFGNGRKALDSYWLLEG